MDYTTVIFNGVATAIMKKIEGPTAVNFWVFLNFFYYETSFIMASLVVLLAVGFSVIAFFKEEADKWRQTGLFTGATIVYHALLQLETDGKINHLSRKILFLSAYLFGFCMFAHYSADLTTTMTVRPREDPFKTFDDIADSDYDVRVFKDNNLHTLLKNTGPSSNFYKMYKQKIENNPAAAISTSYDETNQMLLVRLLAFK